MAEDTPTYDLMVLLSMSVEDERRAKILADIEAAISQGGGSIVHNGDWGTRPMTYRIQHQGEAEYHLFQFTGPTALLDTLRHSLSITDGVLRSRIIKVLPGTPPAPTPTPAASHAAAHAPAGAAASAAGVAESQPAEAEPQAAELEPQPPESEPQAPEPETSAEIAPEPETSAEIAPEPETAAEPDSPSETAAEPSGDTAE